MALSIRPRKKLKNNWKMRNSSDPEQKNNNENIVVMRMKVG